jgi:cyclopropane fatty-acyl-phospholipid synthase-like methyltransferase
MTAQTQFIDTPLAQLPRGLALQWPGGRAGASGPSVLLKLRHRQLLTHLASGRIGDLADAYVRGDLDIEGALTDMMAVAGALVGNPVQQGKRAPWMGWLTRLRSRWLHGTSRGARQVRFHYDVCDEFHGLWLDPAQVSRLIDASGLAGPVEVRLLDCRKLQEAGEFDRIASVGMFEHGGQAQMARQFGILERLLRPGGLLLNHAIAAGGIDNDELGADMGDFIEKHIFPGGELMHVTRAAEGLARCGLELLDAENLRRHYARTLWAWSDRLEQQLERARALTDAATVRACRKRSVWGFTASAPRRISSPSWPRTTDARCSRSRGRATRRHSSWHSVWVRRGPAVRISLHPNNWMPHCCSRPSVRSCHWPCRRFTRAARWCAPAST